MLTESAHEAVREIKKNLKIQISVSDDNILAVCLFYGNEMIDKDIIHTDELISKL